MGHLLLISARTSGRAVVVALSGELDMATAPELRSALRDLEETHPPLLVLDVRDLTYLDSTGCLLMTEAGGRAADDGRRLVVLHGLGAAHRVMALVRLDEVVEMVEDLRQIDV
jgi:anti-sigma B factor antagonist